MYQADLHYDCYYKHNKYGICYVIDFSKDSYVIVQDTYGALHIVFPEDLYPIDITEDICKKINPIDKCRIIIKKNEKGNLLKVIFKHYEKEDLVDCVIVIRYVHQLQLIIATTCGRDRSISSELHDFFSHDK